MPARAGSRPATRAGLSRCRGRAPSSMTSSSAPSAGSGTSPTRQRPRPGPLAHALVLERRRRRLRPDRLPDRRRARAGSRARGGPAAQRPRCGSSRRAPGRPRGGRRPATRVLLPLPRHEDGAALPDGRALDDRHGSARRRRALLPVVLRPRRPGRDGDPRRRRTLYRRVEWDWAQPRPPRIAMGWTPEEGFHSWNWQRATTSP